MKLLTRANAKLVKGERRGYVSFILHLAPAKLSGYEVCGGRSPECTKLCLNTSGRGKFNATQQARIKKTKWFFEDRGTFMAQLVKDISTAIRYGMRHNLTVCVRLNGTSDIPWESIQCGNYANIMERYPFVQFYDYTKLAGRKNLPSNYHLTFSLSETNHAQAVSQLNAGSNVAVVFDHIPLMWQGKPVISGDEDDLRFLDPPQHVIGLKAKGAAVNSQSAFIQRIGYGKPTSSFVPRITGRGHGQGGQSRGVGVARQRQARVASHSLSR
jgi:hypothetical protein